jgi:hypothetical protein
MKNEGENCRLLTAHIRKKHGVITVHFLLAAQLYCVQSSLIITPRTSTSSNFASPITFRSLLITDFYLVMVKNYYGSVESIPEHSSRTHFVENETGPQSFSSRFPSMNTDNRIQSTHQQNF